MIKDKQQQRCGQINRFQHMTHIQQTTLKTSWQHYGKSSAIDASKRAWGREKCDIIAKKNRFRVVRF